MAKPIPTIIFRRTKYEIHFGKYQVDGTTTAIWLEEANTGEFGTDVTKYIEGVNLRPDEVLVKNYSENEGLLPILIRDGILKSKGVDVESGFVTLHLCQLLINPKEYDYEKS